MTRALFAIGVLLLGASAHAAVFSSVEYGAVEGEVLLLDVRMPDKPGPFPVWAEWIAPGAVPLLAQDRELHAADTVLVRAVQPAERTARRAAASHLMAWLSRSVSRYAGDRERMLVIARGDAAQSLLDLGERPVMIAGSESTPLTGLRALVLIEPPDDLAGSEGWPEVPVLLVDGPQRAASLWRTALRLRNRGIAAEPVLVRDPAHAPSELSRQLAAVMQASTVPRVQRFEQLAYDPPSTLRRPVLDALSDPRGVLALQQRAGTKIVSLSILDAAGHAREIARGAWGKKARLLRMGTTPMLAAADSDGRPLIEWEHADGSWRRLDSAVASVPIELAGAQGGASAAVLLWRERRAVKGRQRFWLQRLEPGGSASPRVAALLPVEDAVRAMALAAGDAVVAVAGGNMDAEASTSVRLWRWSLQNARLEPIQGAPPGNWQALYGLTPPMAVDVSGPTLLGLRDGRLFSIDLACKPVCMRDEMDLAAVEADDAITASTSKAASTKNAKPIGRSRPGRAPPLARWLQHPDTGETLLGLFLQDAVGATGQGQRWLIRQASARYALAQVPLPAGSALLGVFGPLPGGSHRNRFVAIAAGNQGSTWLTAQLTRAAARPGLWFDRNRTGHGIELRRIDRYWQATVYTFDAGGQPIWYREDGDISGGRWQSSADGLLRYRREKGRGEVKIDRRSAQSLSIDFGPTGDAADCDPVSRPGAPALAAVTLTVGEDVSSFCIEPMLLAPAGRPAVDVDGTWSAREDHSPWQLSLSNQGLDPDARISVFLTYFDASGAPRWAYGVAGWRQGRTSIDLNAVRGPCPLCEARPLVSRRFGVLDLRARGECGQVKLLAEFRIDPASAEAGIFPRTLDLLAVAPLGCY